MTDETQKKEPAVAGRYATLVGSIGQLLQQARGKAARAVNTLLVDTYWQVGRYIVEYEQQGRQRAEYGSNLLNRLSADLTRLYGSGFSKSNLLYIRKFYLTFQKGETVSHLLTWSHYFEILKLDDPLAISFYAKECERGHWSVRELKRQMRSMLFHPITMELALDGIPNQLFVSRYQLYLPDRAQLERELMRIMDR